MTVVGIALGGAAGAVARYVVDSLVTSRYGRRFPWGILIINVTGSLILGTLGGLALHHGLPNLPMAIVGTGFCGGYTTFSTFTVDTIVLAAEGARARAIVNVVANLLLASAAAAVGLALTGW